MTRLRAWHGNLRRSRSSRRNSTLPKDLSDLEYPVYQSIRFKPDKALWLGGGSNFTAEFFHRGYLYKDRVDIFEVADGHATPVTYSADLFTWDKVTPPTEDLGFAGFRLQFPLNRVDYFDEICAFLGASYFRALARGQGYGLSARGLSIKTADSSGEEFPLFRSFWLERPAPGVEFDHGPRLARQRKRRRGVAFRHSAGPGNAVRRRGNNLPARRSSPRPAWRR